MSKSGNILLSFQNRSTSKNSEDYSPIEVKNAVTLVVAEYMRRIHHERSSDILKGIDKAFHDVASAFYSDQIPNRLLSMLGDIAFLHGVEFYEIFKRLNFESNGISNDKINPRFVATMLRLGDLLDIDDGRFNPFTNGVFKSPDSSIKHQKKHSSIRHFLITPDAIEITADCSEEDIYRLARSWFDWLEIEVENLNKEWSNIAPNDLGGSAPRIPKGKIKVALNNSIRDEKFLNIKFQVSNQKIFEILEGGSIYEKAEFTFLRELVQNAIDASKIQLWSEITRGTYDFAFIKKFNDTNLSHDKIIDQIKFPDDIPKEIYDSFRISLAISWDNTKKENLIIEVSDHGTGISEANIIRMTSKVGESRRGDKHFKEFLDSMPFWLKPTGAFGVGLQSLFIIVDSFRVVTKFEGEIGKEIDFRSSKKNKYSTVSYNTLLKNRGTKVQISIPSKRFPDIFGTSFNWDIISNYDHFTDDFGNIYIHKLYHYISKELYRVDTLSITLLQKKYTLNVKQVLQEPFLPHRLADKEISLNIFIQDRKLIFHFYENIIGSEFSLDFFSDDNADIEHNWPLYQTDFYVRDMPVKSTLISYTALSYCKLTWNFMSPESDKILSLTREKFITKYKDQIDMNFFKIVLKKSLKIANEFINNNIKEIKNKFSGAVNDLCKIYFKFILTLLANQVPINKMHENLLNGDLNKDFASYDDMTQVSYSEFLNAETLIVPLCNHMSQNNAQKKIFKNNLIEKYKCRDIIIWIEDFFSLYLRMNYSISEITYTINGCIIKLKKDICTIDSIQIQGSNEIYLLNFVNAKSISERVWNYSSEKYSRELSVNNVYGSGFEHFPYLSKTSIISPFKNKNQFEFLFAELDAMGVISEEKMENALNNSKIREYVTPSLINWILDNRPIESVETNEEKIIDGYKNLISDMLLAQKKLNIDKQNA